MVKSRVILFLSLIATICCSLIFAFSFINFGTKTAVGEEGSLAVSSYTNFIKYISDGETYKIDEYNVGDTIKSVAVPAKEGYSSCWDKIIPETMPSENLYVNAVYTPTDYYLTFLSKDGDIVDVVSFNVESTSVFTPKVPYIEGYTGTWSDFDIKKLENQTVSACYVNNIIVSEDYGAKKELGKYAYEISNLISDNGGHVDWGLVPGDKWGANVAGGDGYMCYHISTGYGLYFSNLIFNFSCSYGHRSGIYWYQYGGSVLGADLYLDISFDNYNWQRVYDLNEDTSLTPSHVNPIAYSSWEKYSPSVNLTEYVSGHRDFYIRIYIKHFNVEEYNQILRRKDPTREYVDGISLFKLGLNLYSINIFGESSESIIMENGASLNLSKDTVGIRYKSNIPKSMYNSLIEKDYKLTAGTIVVPTSYLTTYGELNYENLFGENAIYSLNRVEQNKVAVADIKSKIIHNVRDDSYFFFGDYLNIKEEDLETKFTGLGYIKCENGSDSFYLLGLYSNYNSEYNSRSLKDIARCAFNDKSVNLSTEEKKILLSKYKSLKEYDLSNVVFENLNCVYDGTAHYITCKGLPEGLNVTFDNNGKIDAGEYQVIAKFLTSEGYYAIENKILTLSISKKLLQVEFVGKTVLEYNGSVQKSLSVKAVNLVGSDSVNLSITYSGEMVEKGTYTATCILQENQNYKLVYGDKVTVVITDTSSYSGIYTLSNWKNMSDGAFTNIENTSKGLRYYGNGYCALPFDLRQGISITFDMSNLYEKTQIDNWAGFGIGRTPSFGAYASSLNADPGFIYFMISLENGRYFMRVQYSDENSKLNSLFTRDLGTNSILTVDIKKLTYKARDNNVDMFINHTRIENEVVDVIAKYSLITNESGNCYMCVNSHKVSGAPTTSGSLYIKNISAFDSISPSISLSREVPKTLYLGEGLILPKIDITDNGELYYVETALYSPSGKLLVKDFSTEKMYIFNQEGKYTISIRALDVSSNWSYKYFDIQVGDNLTPEFLIGTSSIDLDFINIEKNDEDALFRFCNQAYTQDGYVDGLIVSPYYTVCVTDSKNNVVSVKSYAFPTSSSGVHSFGYVDTDEDCFPLKVSISVSYAISSAYIIPEVFNIIPSVSGKTVEFSVNSFDTYNVFFNGKFNVKNPYSLFVRENANMDIPEGYDVVVFNKGVHYLSSIGIKSNTIYYFEQGAYIVVLPHLEGESYFINDFDRYVYTTFAGFIYLQNISFFGHGFVDFNMLYRHERGTFNGYYSDNVEINGLSLFGSPSWTLCFNECTHIHVKDIVGFSYKTNSDGIALCNCKYALVEKCFLRSGDDLFEIKSTNEYLKKMRNITNADLDNANEDIVYKDCQAWAEKTRCFGFIQETRADVKNVKFINCHSLVQNAVWGETMGHESMGAFMVLVGDNYCVHDIKFINCSSYCCAGYVVNISVEHNMWTYDLTKDYGSIHDITFAGFSYYKSPEGYGPYPEGSTTNKKDVRLYNESNDVNKFYNITFTNVVRNGTRVNSLSDMDIVYYNVGQANNVIYKN